jgi:hypothetical protein
VLFKIAVEGSGAAFPRADYQEIRQSHNLVPLGYIGTFLTTRNMFIGSTTEVDVERYLRADRAGAELRGSAARAAAVSNDLSGMQVRPALQRQHNFSTAADSRSFRADVYWRPAAVAGRSPDAA